MHASLVLVETTRGCKSGRTHGTRERFLSSVQSLVFGQFLLRLHLLLTVTALKLWLLVLCQVYDEVVPVAAAMPAVLALELLVVLDDLVPPHRPPVLEGQQADGALGRRLLRPVVLYPDVVRHALLTGKLLATLIAVVPKVVIGRSLLFQLLCAMYSEMTVVLFRLQ